MAKVVTVKDIGAAVRARRRVLGWDQQTLAERIGVSRLWVGEMEKGKPSVQLDLVLRALAALDLSLAIGDGTGSIELKGGAGKSRSAMLISRLLDDH